MYIDMTTKFRKEANNDFEKDFFMLMNNSVFGKNMENVRKHRDIKLLTINKRRDYLVSKPNYHTTKRFSGDLLAMKINKIKVKINNLPNWPNDWAELWVLINQFGQMVECSFTN